VSSDVRPLLERVVAPDEEGGRADVVLAAWLDEPRARAQERLAAGEVRVGGDGIAKSRRLRAGERVLVLPPPTAAPVAAPPPVDVRYDDAHLLVVAKPAGLVVHAGAGVTGPTLVDALQAMQVPLAPGDDPQRPGIVHRLDRGTSGVLVVAKTQAAREGLVATFSRHEIERIYWALVEGLPDPPRATVDAPIARSSTQRTKFVADTSGRRAVSHYDVDVDHGRAAQVTVRLETGRTHQVRVHMAATGHPVVGDRLYGASPVLAEELGLRRPALHARRLAFTHPVTGARVVVDEPLPPDLQAACAALGPGRPVGDTPPGSRP
jgi:23S rRNA pseudouridine1911/1915/1917 synthase